MTDKATMFGMEIGTCEDWDAWDYVDQFFNFKPAKDIPLPRCYALEIDTKAGKWQAYNAANDIFATGTIAAKFERDAK